MRPAHMLCPHGVPRVRVAKLWGTLYLPPVDACAECREAERVREEAEAKCLDAFVRRLQEGQR